MNEYDANLFVSGSSGPNITDLRPGEFQHCERAAVQVATWPEWKQSLLGGKPVSMEEVQAHLSRAIAREEQLEQENAALRAELEATKKDVAALGKIEDALLAERDALRADNERLLATLTSGNAAQELVEARAEVERLTSERNTLVGEVWGCQYDEAHEYPLENTVAEIQRQLHALIRVRDAEAEVERLKAELAEFAVPDVPEMTDSDARDWGAFLDKALADAMRDQERLNAEAEKRAEATMQRLYPPRKSIGAELVSRLRRFSETLRAYLADEEPH